MFVGVTCSTGGTISELYLRLSFAPQLQNLMKNLPPGRGAKDDRTTLQNQGGEEARQQEQNWRSKRELPPLPVGGALDPEVGGKRRSQRSRRTAEDEDGLLEEYERGIAQEEGGRGSGRGQDHPPQKNSKKKLRGWGS